MRKNWKSYLYVPALASVLFGVGMYFGNARLTPETKEPNQVYHLDEYFHMQETVALDTRVTDDEHILLENSKDDLVDESYQFVLKLENDFVVVYRASDLNESYMITGISVNDLPEVTIEELKTGKEILDEEALYFFLESHSS